MVGQLSLSWRFIKVFVNFKSQVKNKYCYKKIGSSAGLSLKARQGYTWDPVLFLIQRVQNALWHCMGCP